METIINRPLYMQKIEPFIGKDLIKVFIGQRRVGKSYLMRSVRKRLLEQSRATQVITIDKEKSEFDDIRDAQSLVKYVQKHAKGAHNALFIDEVQEIEGFERALRSLNATRHQFPRPSDQEIPMFQTCPPGFFRVLSGSIHCRHRQIRPL